MWKQYRLGTVSTGMLGQDLKRWWHKQTGKGDPFEKIAEVNDRTKDGRSDIVWALQDISFSLNQGEVLGIIGKNGAGKSTLLKLLSRITSPTKGEIKIRGRVASLLEVGTGFHPELTGRENVFLNGAILGMHKKEISTKFDEIVAFSGVERYIDTPVKRYSSGMYVRLAFAVAAHLEPEVLIVDEVLAVGDIEFQRKCIGKMKDVSGQGRTILFVSHNIAAVRSLCTTAILVENGMLTCSGSVENVLDKYLTTSISAGSQMDGICVWQDSEMPGDKARLKKITLTNDKNEITGLFPNSSDVNINIEYVVEERLAGIRLSLGVKDSNGAVVFVSSSELTDSGERMPGTYVTTCVIPAKLLNKGIFSVTVGLGKPYHRHLGFRCEDVITFESILLNKQGVLANEVWPGPVAPELNWISKSL